MDSIDLLLTRIAQTLPESRAALRRLKVAVAAERPGALIRNDALLARYRRAVSQGLAQPDARVERILMLNGIRSHSGIATVTVITEPFPCPGRCVYCPTEARAPKSYLTNEPAVMRALRSDYDPYGQVHSRLEALVETGHVVEKIELIIKGGTWSFYPEAYQRWFVQRCFDAANDFAQGSALGVRGSRPQPGARSPEPPDISALEAAQRRNETAGSRIIGLTIETRPDYVDDTEVVRLRELGVTRVELGVQSLEEAVLTRIARDHGTAEVREATRRLKDAGFKVAYHLMPNLPGATPAGDLASARQLFEDPSYRPDALKLYPCVVIETAELHEWWRDGRYQPYDDETLLELLAQIKQLVPPYVRIERVIRDIPSTSIRAGCLRTNLREAVQERLRGRGLRCRCIRCRQVRASAEGAFELIRRAYDASGGTELFLSLEDPISEKLASLLRLRIPPRGAAPARGFEVLAGAALIRELHTYGQHLALQAHDASAAQHRGFGARLLREAERIAKEEFGCERVAVIAGVGAREYYRRLGYALRETYMIKTLD